MASKMRIADSRCVIAKFASWVKGVWKSVSPIIRAICCLGYYALAIGLLTPEMAQATFWVLFVLSLGPRTSWLKLLRAVLGALLDSLN